MFVFFRTRTPLASSDLKSRSGNFLQLTGDLSTREDLEVSLWLIALSPAFQTMEDLSLYIKVCEICGFLESSLFFQKYSWISAFWEIILFLLSCQRPVNTMKVWRGASERNLPVSCPIFSFQHLLLCTPLLQFLSFIASKLKKYPSEGFLSSHPKG